MKIVKTVLLFITLICSTQLHAQNSLSDIKDLSNTNLDNYSDEDLMSFYNKAIESGISQSQLYKIAVDRGLPEAQIAKLRNRLQLLTAAKKPIQNEDVPEKNVAEPHVYDSALQKIPLQKFKNDETIFGSELFTTNSLVFEPNLRIPAPAGYILGPDDEIVVSVYGFSEKKYNLRVNESGEIYIPNVGPLYVSGLSIEQASEKIRSKLASTIYRAINSGQTKVQVSLGKIRSIRVTVIGQAKKPGNYTVSSLTTLYNILYLCGGPTSMGSYRDIQIIRGNTVIRTADLYDFLAEGNQKDNILLQEGDVIRIPYYKNRVTLSGNVKRQGKFEMLENETFSDLLRFSGGFTDNGYRGAVTVIRITDTEKIILDLNANQYSTFKTNGSDEFIVRQLQDEFGNRIFISGSVLRPGPYQLSPNMTVKNLIEKAGGLTVDAYTKRVSIFRYFKNKMPTVLSINLDSVLESNADVYLIKNDSLSVHSIFDFNDNNYVSIEGNIRNPGLVQWRQNLSLRDLLLSSGGISEFGDSSNIEVSRRIRNANVNTANHNETEIFHVNLSDKNDISKDIYLRPFDMVIIKTLPGYIAQRTVLIAGEVKSPGRYSLQKSGDKITDLITRAGGFKASADSNSITIRRNIQSNLTVAEREKLFQRILNIDTDSLSLHPRLKDELYKTYDLISVDLASAMARPSGSENLTLEAGDILTVDRSTNLVKISGEVYYPTIVPYKKNKNLKYYIEQAGSFTPYARKTGALVLQPDGKASSVKHFLWFKSYPSVTPRSEIFVPQKLKSNRARISIGELALVVSALGILANVIKF
ncbi:MAG: SLBB domain-containing protein [Bacteroidota bacterium]|nr:SLBB domain-containing protein [Bacteroidota bacterium]